MTPTSFKETNLVFTKPESMTDEECSLLPVCVTQYPDGTDVIISKWKLSDEELEQVMKEKCVWLHVIGKGTPPVSLETNNPFK